MSSKKALSKIIYFITIIFLVCTVINLSFPFVIKVLGILLTLVVIWFRQQIIPERGNIFFIVLGISNLLYGGWFLLTTSLDNVYYHTIDSQTMAEYYDSYGYRGDYKIVPEACLPYTNQNGFSGINMLDYGITFDIELQGGERGYNEKTEYSKGHCFVRVWHNN